MTVNLSDRLKEYRSKTGITQVALAKNLGVTPDYVRMLESGREVKAESSLVKLFTILESERASSPRGKLAAARIQAGLSQSDLAKKIGYEIGVLQAVEDGAATASEKMIEKICAALPGVAKEDLMSGSDHPVIVGEGLGTYGSKPNIDLPSGMTAKMVPLISWAQAGTMASFEDDSYQHDAVLATNVRDRRAFAVKIRGDSMSPQYGEGDVAVLYPSREPQNGNLVIARLLPDKGGDVMFKIFHAARGGSHVTLTSYNQAYPKLDYERGDFSWIYPVARVIKELLN